MKITEYGKDNSKVIMLLHGGGLSWWNYRAQAELLQNEYHVILPVLDGHADSDMPFTSIEDNAGELIAYIDRSFGGSVLLIGGLSLGGQILVEMLSQRSNICSCAVIESASVIPMELTGAMLGPSLDMSYGLITKKWFAQLQFKSLRIQQSLFDDYYRDSCLIRKQDMISFLKANSRYGLKPEFSSAAAKTVILAGGKEPNTMLRSAKRLHESLTGSELIIYDSYYHGELSLNHPKDYAKLLDDMAKSVN